MIWSAILYAGLLCITAAVGWGLVLLVRPIVHFFTVWSRLTTIATTLGAYDSARQAESAQAPKTGIRPRPPERGHVRPGIGGGWANGLPRCWVIYGKVVPPKARFAEFCEEAEHYTDLAWTSRCPPVPPGPTRLPSRRGSCPSAATATTSRRCGMSPPPITCSSAR
jgi:hypothetical protein